MPRSLRLEYPDALYHVTARGVQQRFIFLDDDDRRLLLRLVARTLAAFDAQVFAYCLMGNHYHFVLHTREANLSALMQRLNASYSQQFNHRHARVGQVFGGRFKAVHVDRDEYLLAVCRYVDLNPVRAGLVSTPQDWAWSGYRAHVGTTDPPHWLATSALHRTLIGQPVSNERLLRMAQRDYAAWVALGRHVDLWSECLRQGAYLGDDDFVSRTKAAVEERVGVQSSLAGGVRPGLRPR